MAFPINSNPRLSQHVINPRLHRLEPRKDVVPQESRSEIERIFQWRKKSKHATRICSPLSPLRNPDIESWSPADGKWRSQEFEQRRQRTLASCDASVFRRKLKDYRSRIECEEFSFGLDVSEHCLRCRQDTLCKRLLVQRARDFIRSRSSSPVSDYSSSSDEALEDEPLFDNFAPLPFSLTEKLVDLNVVEVAGFDDIENIEPGSPPTSAHTHASPTLVYEMDL